jgi:hypothetical protein
MPVTSVNCLFLFKYLTARALGHDALEPAQMHAGVLTAQPQLRDERPVPLEVGALQVVQQPAPASYHLE